MTIIVPPPPECRVPMKAIQLTETLYDYLIDVSLRETDVQRRLRAYTSTLARARMQIAPEQGQFMQWLVRLTGARRIVEVGTFTGYSALAMALALPPDGRLIACDIDPVHTATAQQYWQEAGVADRIELRLGPALDTLDGLITEFGRNKIDLAFIDADKTAHLFYYERLLEMLRPGGVILIDNTLWGGSVADPAAHDADTLAIRGLNLLLRDDDRIDLAHLPVGDGLALALKR